MQPNSPTAQRHNFGALLRDINAERESAAEKIARRLEQWSADVFRAVAICTDDCAPSVHFAARAIEATPRQLQEHEAVVLLGAVFRALYRDDLNRHIEARQDALACVSGAVDELLAEVVRRREGQCEQRGMSA